jgi:cob(I)alamin adenosyltransferase
MVKLTRIYTKSGDQGTTMLGNGASVPKHDLRVEAYGTVDEANAALGVALTAIPHEQGTYSDLRRALMRIQNDMFDVGADLCVPIAADEPEGKSLRVVEAQVTALEKLIDTYNEKLSPLNSFVLPSGTPLAAQFHLARTVVRRAERCTAHLAEVQPETTNPKALIYLNRLSDLLFVLARVANGWGDEDVLWEPGANR